MVYWFSILCCLNLHYVFLTRPSKSGCVIFNPWDFANKRSLAPFLKVYGSHLAGGFL